MLLGLLPGGAGLGPAAAAACGDAAYSTSGGGPGGSRKNELQLQREDAAWGLLCSQ